MEGEKKEVKEREREAVEGRYLGGRAVISSSWVGSILVHWSELGSIDRKEEEEEEEEEKRRGSKER